MTDNKDDLKKAYRDLDALLRRIVTLEGLNDGMLVDWVVLGAVESFNEAGDSISMVARMLPDRGSGTPYYRVLGLLDAGVKGLCMDLGDDDDDEGEALG